jgi:hypothetical protein
MRELTVSGSPSKVCLFLRPLELWNKSLLTRIS